VQSTKGGLDELRQTRGEHLTTGDQHTPNATKDHQRRAWARLQDARGDLLHARLAALDAQLWLVGARVSNSGENTTDLRVKRAAQLCEQITDAVVHAERLLLFVEGDSQ
jgi:hypothetical protein